MMYRDKLVGYDYLVCSDVFKDKGYYEVRAESDNFLHLLGVNTALSAKNFYNKCIDGSLTVNDFDFIKKGQDEAAVKGSVRQKIKALPEFIDMFSKDLFVQEDFEKNSVVCRFAAADSCFTIGFTENGRPKSLMRKNQLDPAKQGFAELIYRKKEVHQGIRKG